MNLTTADILNPASPTAPTLDADFTIRMLLDGPDDYDPIQQLDHAIERLTEARLRYAALAD